MTGDARPRRRWGLRYSLYRRADEKIVGTLMVVLDDVPRGMSASEVAEQWCRAYRPGCDPTMPRSVVLDGLPVVARQREHVATRATTAD
jgi:hypothetical protein